MCSLAKRSASEEIAGPVAERVQQWWGKDNSALKRLALRAVACGNVLSLALESNLGRSFSSFPIGQNIEYRRLIKLGMTGGDGGGGRIRTFEVDDGRFTVCSLWPLGNPTTG